MKGLCVLTDDDQVKRTESRLETRYGSDRTDICEEIKLFAKTYVGGNAIAAGRCGYGTLEGDARPADFFLDMQREGVAVLVECALPDLHWQLVHEIGCSIDYPASRLDNFGANTVTG